MLKILQVKLQQYVNPALPDVQSGFRKGRGTRDQIANKRWITEKARKFKKNHLLLLHWTTLKPLAVWITTHRGIFLKRWEHQTTLPASWETCTQDKRQQLETDVEQRTGSELGKKSIKAVHCHPAYLTYTQSASCERLGWLTHKLESRLPGETSLCR